MQVVGRERIDKASKKHSEWKASLRTWLRIASNAYWRHFADVRQTLKSADSVGRYVIFDIANNRARLVSIINYQAQRVVVVKILDHSKYNREDFEK